MVEVAETAVATFEDLVFDYAAGVRSLLVKGSKLLAAIPVVLRDGPARFEFVDFRGTRVDRVVPYEELGFDADTPGPWPGARQEFADVSGVVVRTAKCYDAMIAKAGLAVSERAVDMSGVQFGCYRFLVHREFAAVRGDAPEWVKRVVISDELAEWIGLPENMGVALRLDPKNGICLFAQGLPQVRHLGDLSDSDVPGGERRRPPVMRTRVDLNGVFCATHARAAQKVRLS